MYSVFYGNIWRAILVSWLLLEAWNYLHIWIHYSAKKLNWCTYVTIVFVADSLEKIKRNWLIEHQVYCYVYQLWTAECSFFSVSWMTAKDIYTCSEQKLKIWDASNRKFIDRSYYFPTECLYIFKIPIVSAARACSTTLCFSCCYAWTVLFYIWNAYIRKTWNIF
jgi:hypothetical protein